MMRELVRGAYELTTDGYKTHSAQGGALIAKFSNSHYTCFPIISDINCASVAPIELITLVLAATIADTTLTTCRIYSDSQSSIDIINKIRSNTIQKTLLTYAISKATYGTRPLEWVQSHVEKRNKNMTTWTSQEKGNYLADKMASYDWGDSQITTVQLDTSVTVSRGTPIILSKFLDSISQMNSFSVRSNTQQHFIGDLIKLSVPLIMKTYLKTRDSYRTKRLSRPTRFWQNRVTDLIQYTHRSPKSASEAAVNCRIIYNKHWHSSNQFKYCGNKQMCPLCGQGLESQTHILFHCANPHMKNARDEIQLNINSNIKKQIMTHPKLANILFFIRDQAIALENPNIWVGLWTSKFLKVIETMCTNVYNNPNKIAKFTRIYTDGTKLLYQTRAKTIAALHTPSQPPTKGELLCEQILLSRKITEFFKADINNPKQQKGKVTPNLLQKQYDDIILQSKQRKLPTKITTFFPSLEESHSYQQTKTNNIKSSKPSYPINKQSTTTLINNAPIYPCQITTYNKKTDAVLFPNSPHIYEVTTDNIALPHPNQFPYSKSAKKVSPPLKRFFQKKPVINNPPVNGLLSPNLSELESPNALKPITPNKIPTILNNKKRKLSNTITSDIRTKAVALPPAAQSFQPCSDAEQVTPPSSSFPHTCAREGIG